MKKREAIETSVKLGSLESACKRYGLGKCSMRDAGDKANAVVRVGRRYLLNFSILDAYFDSITGDK